MKKVLAILLSVMLILGILAGCGSQAATSSTTAEKSADKPVDKPAEKPADKPAGKPADNAAKKVKVGATLKDLSDQFVKNIGDAMLEHAKGLNGQLEFDLQDAQGDVSKQIDQVEAFIAKKYDAIIMVAQDAEGCGAAVEKAAAAGIPLIECNTLTKNDKYTCYVGSDDVNAGKMQAEFLKDLLPKNAQVVYLMGPIGQSPQIYRKEGIQKYLFDVRKDIKVLDEQTAEWKRDKAMALTENWLTKYGTKINAVICQNDDMAMGALSAVQAKGFLDKIVVVGVDAIPDALQAVKDGKLACTVFQNSKAQATGSVDAALKAAKKEKLDKVIDIPFELVTKDKVDKYMGKNAK